MVRVEAELGVAAQIVKVQAHKIDADHIKMNFSFRETSDSGAASNSSSCCPFYGLQVRGDRREIEGSNFSMQIAVISPHRDDAAFSLTLTIECLLSDGHAVDLVACFTRSEYAPFADRVDAAKRVQSVSSLRRDEDTVWSTQFPGVVTAGKFRMIDLGLRDAPLRLGVAVDQVCQTGVDGSDSAVDEIQTAIEGLAVDAVLLPLAVGTHVDHVAARDAGLRAALAGGPCAFYEDLPYAARPGAAQSLPALARAIGIDLRSWLVPSSQDSAWGEARKRSAAQCYSSQVSPTEIETIAGFCRRYDGRERLWCNAAWSELFPMGVHWEEKQL